MQTLEALFGRAEPEPISDALRSKLHALRPVPIVSGFKAVPGAPARVRSWGGRAAAVAAAVLAAVGLFDLLYRAEVPLRAVTRIALDSDDRATSVDTRASVVLRAGARLETSDRERLLLTFADESVAVLLPGGALVLGDPAEELFRLERGTVLCTLRLVERERCVRAGAVAVYGDNAVFGARVEGEAAHAMGAAAPAPPVTIAVTRGSIEVAKNGERETVERGVSVHIDRDRTFRRAPAWADALYVQILRAFQVHSGREILPGYFDGEGMVLPIPPDLWAREGDRYVHAVTTAPPTATHLVVQARAAKPTRLRLTRIVPAGDGVAETATVDAGAVGASSIVLSIPLASLDADGAEQGERAVPPSRSQLVRLELASADGTALELESSLWAARPPAGSSEVIR